MVFETLCIVSWILTQLATTDVQIYTVILSLFNSLLHNCTVPPFLKQLKS